MPCGGNKQPFRIHPWEIGLGTTTNRGWPVQYDRKNSTDERGSRVYSRDKQLMLVSPKDNHQWMLCVLPQPESDSDCVAGGDADGDRRIVVCLVILGGVPCVGWLGVSLSVTQKLPCSRFSRRRLLALLSPASRRENSSGE